MIPVKCADKLGGGSKTTSLFGDLKIPLHRSVNLPSVKKQQPKSKKVPEVKIDGLPIPKGRFVKGSSKTNMW